MSAEEGRETSQVQYTRRGWFTHPTGFLLLLWHPISLPPGKEGPSMTGSQQWPLGHHPLHTGHPVAASGPSFACLTLSAGYELGLPPSPQMLFYVISGSLSNFWDLFCIVKHGRKPASWFTSILVREWGEFTDSVITQPYLLGKSGRKSQIETEKPVKDCF